MKLNTIGLATAGSLLCVAFCQPIEARSIRGDGGGGDWVASQSPPTIGGDLTLNTGLNNYFMQTYVPNPNASLYDAFNEGGVELAIATPSPTTPSIMYNYWSSQSAYEKSQQSPQDQIMVYTLGDNSQSGLTYNPDPGNSSLKGDIEIDVNYGDPVSSMSFEFNKVTYTYTASPSSPPNANLLFSSTFGFLGFLSDDGTNANSGITATLADWTISGGTVTAPEIDPSSAVAALTLLAGVLLVGRGNTRSRARVAADG